MWPWNTQSALTGVSGLKINAHFFLLNWCKCVPFIKMQFNPSLGANKSTYNGKCVKQDTPQICNILNRHSVKRCYLIMTLPDNIQKISYCFDTSTSFKKNVCFVVTRLTPKILTYVWMSYRYYQWSSFQNFTFFPDP